ncbi:large subunit of alpha-aminoadipate reductase [Mortierella antarctica]|nr:large subunit of alpha-aminoadipate reductase [Mortierella antarctica]
MKLPEYMVPAAFVCLDAFPLTPNSKLDRHALPSPGDDDYARQNYEAPQGDIELALVSIWSDLLHAKDVSRHDNFFALGGHSILATRLIFELRRVCDVDVPLSIVFQSPTIEGMAKELNKARMDGLGQIKTDQETLKETIVAVKQEKAFDYGADFEALLRTEIQDVYPRVARQEKVDYQTFFLTGATGFLGAFILSTLMAANPTARVICLARARSEDEAMGRVRSCGVAYLTWNEDWVTSGRLSAVKGDLDLDRFGLAPEVWEKCCHDVDIIIHNGALVNGVLPYDKVRATNVLGTLQGIKMASTYHTKSFHFVSTISVIDTEHYHRLSGALAQTAERGIPETDNLEGSRQGLHSGYGQSKWVAEKLIMASNKKGLPATIIRPGYIVGHTRTGVINTGDLIWRLIKVCAEIGSAPNMNAPVNFSPVDYVAHCVVSVATTPGTEADMVYQVTHSITTPFRLNEFFETMNQYGYAIQRDQDSVWRAALTKHALKSQDMVFFLVLHIQTEHLPGISTWPEMSDVNTQRVIFRQLGFDAAPKMTTKMIGMHLAYMVKTGFLSRPSVQGDDVLPLPELEAGGCIKSVE